MHVLTSDFLGHPACLDYSTCIICEYARGLPLVDPASFSKMLYYLIVCMMFVRLAMVTFALRCHSYFGDRDQMGMWLL
jgi:hypothetical protein